MSELQQYNIPGHEAISSLEIVTSTEHCSMPLQQLGLSSA